MFTGIVQKIGTVALMKRNALEVLTDLKCKLGNSVAVNGACLTVAACRDGRLSFDVSRETLRLTNLGGLKAGMPVNLEPSLRAGDALGGHLVSGHVDARARILALAPLPGGFKRLKVELPGALRGLVALKGSIAVDGISLTVAKASRSYFETVLVPHTLKNTNLGRCKKGSVVNLEADMLARYVQSALKNP